MVLFSVQLGLSCAGYAYLSCVVRYFHGQWMNKMNWYRECLLVRILVALVRFLPENEHDKSRREFLGFYVTNTNVKGGPEPLEKEIHEILG